MTSDTTPPANQPPALDLPDGWTRYADCWRWISGSEYDESVIYVDPSGIEVSIGGASTPDDARAVAARFVEAASILEQLRAGAK